MLVHGRPTVLAWLLPMLLALAGCERKPVDNVYFPLTSGLKWTYTLTAEVPPGEPAEILITSHGEEELGGQRVTRERVDVGGETHWLFVAVDHRGVYRYATQSQDEEQPVLETTRDYYLVYPLEVGASWRGESEPSFLEARVRVPIESKVESTSETVAVPAGEFRDCVKVKTTGHAPLPGDPPRTFTVSEEVWYAKNVGMVRSVVVETMEGGGEDQRVEVRTELAALER